MPHPVICKCYNSIVRVKNESKILFTYLVFFVCNIQELERRNLRAPLLYSSKHI